MNVSSVKKVKSSKPFTALDCIILIVLVAVVVISAVLIYQRPAATVTVRVGDRETAFSLDEDRVIELGVLTVIIENGEVWVTDADCADKTCERTGRISRSCQSIVCLPNEVVITIGGKSDLQWETGR